MRLIYISRRPCPGPWPLRGERNFQPVTPGASQDDDDFCRIYDRPSVNGSSKVGWSYRALLSTGLPDFRSFYDRQVVPFSETRLIYRFWISAGEELGAVLRGRAFLSFFSSSISSRVRSIERRQIDFSFRFWGGFLGLWRVQRAEKSIPASDGLIKGLGCLNWQ